MKRTFDLVVAAALLLLLCPLLTLIALAVWLDEPGSVVYRGQRVGRGGRVFAIFKFRTMTTARATSRAITVSHDPRVTRIGRVLRAAKLDELPQLVNVLRGEMSLVGPRPESPQYVALYTPEQRAVLAVTPGITGPSQLVFRHEEQLLTGPDPEHLYQTVIMPAKLGIDLNYVATHTFWGDLAILGRTVGAVIRPGARPAAPVAPSGETDTVEIMEMAAHEAPLGKRTAHG